MKISKERLLAISSETGFRAEIVEKVIRLIDLLNTFVNDEFLRSRIALKGGTALNLFYFDLPRLSVDIDLNYIGSSDREKMLEDKPVLLSTIEHIFNKKNYHTLHQPTEHAGGKWTVRYQSNLIPYGQLEIDLNFISRVALWPISNRDSSKLGNFQAQSFPGLEYHDLIGGKLTALFSRHSSRDLFDAYSIFSQSKSLNFEKLKIAFLVYGAAARNDWRTISLAQLQFNPTELKNMLLPMLRVIDFEPKKILHDWANELMGVCHHALSKMLPFEKHEIDFLTHIQDHGVIKADLITTDPLLIKAIHDQPVLRWKCHHVLNYKNMDLN